MDREVLKIWTLENMRCRESDLKVVNLQSDDYQIQPSEDRTYSIETLAGMNYV
jgi:hypothetical protein